MNSFQFRISHEILIMQLFIFSVSRKVVSLVSHGGFNLPCYITVCSIAHVSAETIYGSALLVVCSCVDLHFLIYFHGALFLSSQPLPRFDF